MKGADYEPDQQRLHRDQEHPASIDPLPIRWFSQCSLASAIDLERQATQAHWNVKGPNFIAPHELFDKVAEATEEFSDLLAERVTALGGTAEGRLQAVTVQSAALPVYPGEVFSGREHVDALSTSLAAFRQGGA